MLPFARFPGADPVLGPEMRSTGEVMTSANDLPTALAKAERAAGRPLPREGAVFLSVRDSDKATAIPVAAAFAGLGFQLYATGGTARTLRGAGLDVDEVRKVNDPGDGPSVVDLIRRGRCNLIVNTPGRRPGAARRRLPDPRGGADGARPVHHDDRGRDGGGARDRERARRDGTVLAGAHRCREPRRERRRVVAVEAVGPYALVRVERGGIDPGVPGQFFMLEAPGRVLPRPMSLCLAPPRRARVPARPDRPGHARARGAGAGRRARTSSVRSATASVSTCRGRVLVGGGIGIAPLPYLVGGARASACGARLPLRAPRGSGGAGPERRGRDRSRCS